MTTYADIQGIALAQVPPGPFPTTDVEPPFAGLVRSASYILTENNPFTYELIREITPPVYFDAFTYLATKRKEIYAGITTNADGSTQISTTDINDDPSLVERQFLYIIEDVQAMMTPDGGANPASLRRYELYGDAVRWYVANLVAARLIRNIPLNTSSLKQVDVADTLETQAYAGLDRIVDLSNVPLGGSDTNNDDGANDGVTLYIAHDLDKSTILEPAFNVPDVGSNPPTFDGVLDFRDTVSFLRGTVTPPNSTCFCYFYMTGQAYNVDRTALLDGVNNTDSRSVSYKIEDAFEVPNATNIDDLIMILADNINNKTLTELCDLDPSVGNCVGNILVSPDRGADRLQTLRATKCILYPDTDVLKTRQAQFRACHRSNYLTFDVRRVSSKASRELITIAFYTTGTDAWNDWVNNVSDLAVLRRNSTLGIDGLIFGQSSSFYRMNAKSPVSFILNVDKSGATPVSIQTPDDTGEVNDQFGDAGDLAQTDTFYFAVEDPFTQFSSNLTLRVSSTSYLSESPAIITVDLSDITPALNAPPNCVGEKVAERVVAAIYDYTSNANLNDITTDNTNVLGVLLGQYQYEYISINQNAGTVNTIDLTDSEPKDDDAGRVQIVGFRYREEEFKIVVDLIQIPPELWVSTGNYLTRRTFWVKGKPRSICVETKVLNTAQQQTAQTDAEVLASVSASVTPAEASMSPLLQRVYDKKKLLKDVNEGYPRTRRWQT